MNDEDENGPEPTAVICRVWPTGCAHPQLCQDACFDDDIVRERGAQEGATEGPLTFNLTAATACPKLRK
jgi:hypothetical protein